MKDNDVVYLDPIPSPNALTPLEKAQLAQITPFPAIQTLQSTVGAPLFSNLYPFAVHNQLLAYKERKNNVMRSWTEKCQKANQDCAK